jgi:hypothetical protein
MARPRSVDGQARQLILRVARVRLATPSNKELARALDCSESTVQRIANEEYRRLRGRPERKP